MFRDAGITYRISNLLLKTNGICSGQQTIRRSARADSPFFFERKEREDSGCNMRRSSSALAERVLILPAGSVIWQILFSLRRRRRRRWTTVDDAGLDDSSRTHISRSVRSCGNFDIPEYGARARESEAKFSASYRGSCAASILGDTSHFPGDSDLRRRTSSGSRRCTYWVRCDPKRMYFSRKPRNQNTQRVVQSRARRKTEWSCLIDIVAIIFFIYRFISLCNIQVCVYVICNIRIRFV